MDWDARRVGRHLKLRDLNVLMTVARCGSMGKAAAQLSVSQPAISKAIADMEHTLGVRLLDRSALGVEPTIYASALLDHGIIAFDELQQAIRKIEHLPIQQPGMCGSDARSSSAKDLLPALLTGCPSVIRA